LKVFVGDIAKRGIGGIALAEKISEVAVDLSLWAMELKIEATLGVRDGVISKRRVSDSKPEPQTRPLRRISRLAPESASSSITGRQRF
jgi:hypothetical protein